MLLAAISGIMKRALLDIAPKDLDEVIVIVPDTNKEELEHFQNFIYGHNFEKQPFAPKLFELLQIENPSFPKDFLMETNTELHKEDLECLNRHITHLGSMVPWFHGSTLEPWNHGTFFV